MYKERFRKWIAVSLVAVVATQSMCTATFAETASSENGTTTDAVVTTTEATTKEEVTTTEAQITTTTTEHKGTTTTENKKTEGQKTSGTTERSTSKKDQTSATTTEKKIEQKKVIDLSKEKEKAKEDGKASSAVIPKIYGDHRLEMKNKKEYIGGYIYFNQGDAAWNDNGYHIGQAGCGPTSMAVVISSLTNKWVTPLDTTVWAYQHHFYSRAGSQHSLIPALANAYNLKCQGVGRDYGKIKTALQNNNPVVALMGPGYFTRGGHFMVLVAIDKNDNVTVADVGSRVRSSYKYKLKDVIAQSKAASAGGPFWVVERPADSSEKDKKKAQKRTPLSYEVMKENDTKTIKKTVQSGVPVMVMTDGKVIDQQDFLYITVVDSQNLATVTDKKNKVEKQILLSDLMKHKKADVTGIYSWRVLGDCNELMPIMKQEFVLREE